MLHYHHREGVLLTLWVVILIWTEFSALEACPTEDSRLLQPDHEYTYIFKSEASSDVEDGVDTASIECYVTVAHSSSCIYNMQLHNCNTSGLGFDDKSIDGITRYPVSFSLSEGEGDILTHEDDPIHSLNIKRAVLSAFTFIKTTSSYTTHQEMTYTDVHGVCPLTIYPMDTAGERVETKKDLLHCSTRLEEKQRTSLNSLYPFNTSSEPSGIHSIAVCKYHINKSERRIQSVHCREEHTDFTQDNAQINILYTMKFLKSVPLTTKIVHDELVHKKSIIFVFDPHHHDRHDCDDDIREGQNILLRLIKQSSKEGVKLSTTSLFANFVSWIESCSNLHPFVDWVLSCFHLPDCSSIQKDVGMSYLSDALLQCNTMECFESLALLIRHGKLSPGYRNFVFYLWSRKHQAKPQMIDAFFTTCKETSSSLCWTSLGTLIFNTRNEISKESQLLANVASYLTDAVVNLCISKSKDHNRSKLSLYLKVIENMGDTFWKLMPSGQVTLMKCVTEHGNAEHNSLLVLKSLERMEFPEDHLETSRHIYEESLSIMKASNVSTELRTASFKLILRLPQDFSFDKEVMRVLMKDENVHFKANIAGILKELLLDEHKTEILTKDLVSQKTFIERLKVALSEENILLEKLIKQSNSKSFSFVDNLLEKLPFISGIKKIAMKLYHLHNHLPNQFKIRNFWKNLFQVGLQAEGMEAIAITIKKYLSEMEEEEPLMALHKIQELLQEVIMQLAATTDLNEFPFKFKESILLNIKALVDKFKKNATYIRPFFNAHLDMFGSTIMYFTSEDFLKLIFNVPEMNSLFEAALRGVSWNSTRMTRLSDSAVRVPTLMGVPIMWKRYSLLATSLRSFFKLEMANDIRIQASLKPRFGLTSINRMELFTTEIGFETNSSTYSSFQLPVILQLTENTKMLKLEKPSESQTLLQSIKIKQSIKKQGDLTPESTLSSWCSTEYTSSLFGLEVCSKQSQSEWSKKWHLTLKHTNNEKSFEATVTKYPPNENRIFGLRTSGGDKNYELLLHYEVENDKQLRMYVTMLHLPAFVASFQSDNKHYKLSLKTDENHEYSLTYSNEEDLENLPKYARTRILKLTCPDSAYELKRKDTAFGKEMTSELNLSYECLEERGCFSKWIPAFLWEKDSKAWIKLKLIFKEGEITSSIHNPKFTTEISKKMRGENELIIRMTKTETSSGKVVSYVDFSSNNWSLESKEASVWNVSIPKKSWSLYWEKVGTSSGMQHQIELKQVSMTPKNFLSSEKIEMTCGEFDRQENQVRAVVDIDFPSSLDIELESNEVEETKYNQAVDVKATVSYDKHPLVSAKGRIMMSGGQTYTYRFQENFEVVSSYSDLKLNTNSVYKVVSDDEVSFHHHSSITHQPSQKEFSNVMNFRRFLSAEGCREFTWAHDIRSYFFDSTTRASYFCHTNTTNLRTLKLHWLTNSSYWKALNMEVDQIFDDVHLERTVESCNITFSNSVVNVTAEWDGPHRDHRKTAIRTCKSEDCQNVKIFMKYLHNGEFLMRVYLPPGDAFLFARNISEDALSLNALMKCSSSFREGEKEEVIELNGSILQNDLQVWRVGVSPGFLSKIVTVFASAYNEVLEQVMSTIQDPLHPLNKQLLYPTTLYSVRQNTMQNVKEILFSPLQEIFGVFYDVYEVPIGLLYTVKESALNVFYFLKENHLMTWIFDQFHQNLEESFNFSKEDRKFVFEFTTENIFNLSSFKEWPTISFNPPDETLHYPLPSLPLAKMEVFQDYIHISTFDGSAYTFHSRNDDQCLFLMAHDIRISPFSVVTSGKSLHLLFPEMTVTIDQKNEVFINGSLMVSPSQQSLNKRVAVEKKTSGSVEVRSPSIRVECKGSLSCLFEMDEWLDTIGLLGNADGIRENEYRLPDGRIAKDILEFIRSYEISQNDDCKKEEMTTFKGNICEEEAENCIT